MDGGCSWRLLVEWVVVELKLEDVYEKVFGSH